MKSGFVDTNILVYAAEESTPIARKTVIAREVLLLPELYLSVQVLSEFIASARNPRKLALPSDREAEWIEEWLGYPIAALNCDTFLNAIEIHGQYQLSHWDSLILATARQCGCDTLFSEDLSDGQDYGGIRVVNPFR